MKPLCSYDGCDRPVQVKGMCEPHYKKVRYAAKKLAEAGQKSQKPQRQLQSRPRKSASEHAKGKIYVCPGCQKRAEVFVKSFEILCLQCGRPMQLKRGE